MAGKTPNLIWLRTFEAAARLSNFTAAGKELGLTQTAVSLHIKALEETLGCKLFLRTPRHLSLTEVGEAYALAVRKSIGDINLSTASLFGMAKKQLITVRAPISTVALWLAPRLPEFLAEYPNINVRLISTIWANSVTEDDVDIDLRFGFGDWPETRAEKISTEMIVPIAPKSLRDLTPFSVADEQRPLIQILGYDDNWEKYFAAHDIARRETGLRLSVDTSVAAVALVSASSGCAVILERYAKQAVRSGHPVAIIGAPIAFPQAHYLTGCAVEISPRPEVELFKEWLRNSLATG